MSTRSDPGSSKTKKETKGKALSVTGLSTGVVKGAQKAVKVLGLRQKVLTKATSAIATAEARRESLEETPRGTSEESPAEAATSIAGEAKPQLSPAGSIAGSTDVEAAGDLSLGAETGGDWSSCASPVSQMDDDASDAGDWPPARTSMLPARTRKATGVAMDLATHVANESFLKAKDAIEGARNMKTENKASALEGIQTLYEIVLSLADSRSRAKVSLEQERVRAAKELVRVERAHAKQLEEMQRAHLEMLTEVTEAITKTHTVAKDIREWLWNELEGPIKTIGGIQEGLKSLLSRTEQAASVPQSPLMIDRSALLEEALTDVTLQIRRQGEQLETLSLTLDRLPERLQRVERERETSPRPPVEDIGALTAPVVAGISKILKPIQDSIARLESKPELPPGPTRDDVTQIVRVAVEPIHNHVRELRTELSDLGDIIHAGPSQPGTSGIAAEIALTEIKDKVERIEAGMQDAGKQTKGKMGTGEVIGEVKALRTELKDLLTKPAPSMVPATKEAIGSRPRPSYAEKVKQKPTPRPNHTLIISSTDPSKTGDKVVEAIRAAVDTKKSGARIDRLKKAGKQKVVLNCSSREDLELVRSKVSSHKELRAEEARKRNPLIVIKDVLAYHTDADVVEQLRVQNKQLFHDVSQEDNKIRIRYRKKARNPLECHPVLELSPTLHKRFLEAEKVYIGLQRRPVEDQSPLMQCAQCLGFGHTRATCREGKPTCSHCGEGHTWDKCKSRQEGKPPCCANCTKAQGARAGTAHNAFSTECPEKQKWDRIARSRITYC